VAMPTETVYGLAAPIDNPAAIEKIFTLKERPFFDPLIVHIASIDDLPKLTDYSSDLLEVIVKKFWPGPLTIVLPRKDTIHPMICSGLPSIAVRFPSHPLAQKLISATGVPLAAPSANKFGKTSPTKAEHVRKTWSEDEVFVLDGGPSEVGIESTVIQLHPGEKSLHILRKGIISREMLEHATEYKAEVRYAESSASPGHTPDHYMPEIPLVIVQDVTSPLSPHALEKINAALLSENLSSYGILELEENPLLAARTLYEKLHQFSASGYDFVIVSRNHTLTSETNSHWDAIWDRLERAARYELR
jgi:L-threonylcarbamoyladenylate synthase